VAPWTRTALLSACAHALPPVEVHADGRLTLARYPGEVHGDLPERLAAATGPLPSPPCGPDGRPLARDAVPAPDPAGMFTGAATPLAARSWGRPVEKLAWHPLTGRLYLVHPPAHHATALRGQPFHDHVRLIVLHLERRLCIRPCVPRWAPGGTSLHPDAAQAWLSVQLQLAARAAVLSTAEPGTWLTELNVNNRRLEARTGRRGW